MRTLKHPPAALAVAAAALLLTTPSAAAEGKTTATQTQTPSKTQSKVGILGGTAFAKTSQNSRVTKHQKQRHPETGRALAGAAPADAAGQRIPTTIRSSAQNCNFVKRGGMGYLTLYSCRPAPSARARPNPARPAAARAVDPQVVAREAVARLRLTAPTPAVGPPPSINRWKMAAVGYPLWLWVDGNTNPAPVTDSDGPLSVRLDARVAGISFDMGDGHTVSCVGAGTKWTRSVAAGQPSPGCGYRYTKPSLPDGNYTVVATTHWAIDWNINGTTGTIPYSQSASTPVPVGELQVLVR